MPPAVKQSHTAARMVKGVIDLSPSLSCAPSEISVALNYNRLLTEWETETARLALVHLKRWRIARYSWVRYLTDISTEIKD
jgi:hypothetical protein